MDVLLLTMAELDKSGDWSDRAGKSATKYCIELLTFRMANKGDAT